VGLLLRAFEQAGVGFVHADEFLKVLDAEVGKRHDAVVADAVDPDASVLGFHFSGNFPEPIFVIAEFFGDAVDSGDVMDLVDVHGQAARFAGS
jgi:hypothetical protein